MTHTSPSTLLGPLWDWNWGRDLSTRAPVLPQQGQQLLPAGPLPHKRVPIRAANTWPPPLTQPTPRAEGLQRLPAAPLSHATPGGSPRAMWAIHQPAPPAWQAAFRTESAVGCHQAAQRGMTGPALRAPRAGSRRGACGAESCEQERPPRATMRLQGTVHMYIKVMKYLCLLKN